MNRANIVTMTLNPCIDRTLTIESLVYGGLNRVISTRTDVCGKGVNVSRALKNLGIESICLGINYSENGRMLTNALDDAGIAHDFVFAPGEIRTNIKVFEQSTRTMTEINSKGDPVTDDIERALMQKLKEYASASVFILSGSIPPGLPVDIYAQMIRIIRDTNPTAMVILDADGEALRLGVAERPDIIKPNSLELSHLCGESDANQKPNINAIVDQCKRVIDNGVKIICVSMGAEGALIKDGQRHFFSPVLDIEVKGIQGAGDSMVAGIAAGIAAGITSAINSDKPSDVAELLRFAQAAAAASLVREGTLLCTREGFEDMLTRASIQEV